VANLIGVVQSSYFMWGIAMGGLGLLITLAIIRRNRAGAPLAMGGVMVAAAVVASVGLAGEQTIAMWSGIALILAGTGITGALGGSSVAIALASIPGAYVIALTASADPQWVRPLIVIATPVVGYLFADFESRYADHGFGIIFFGLAAMGAFLAVPDTELSRSLFAVCLPMSLTAWPRPLLGLGRSGAYMAASIFMLFTTVGGIGRPASVVGALACLGFLAVEPLAARARPGLRQLPSALNRTPEAALLAAVPQFGVVLVASRVAARFESIPKAAGVSFAVVCAAYLLLVWAQHSNIPDSVEHRSDV